MDSREFLASAPGSVGRDKLFFYKFFKEKAVRDMRAGKHKKKGGGEDDSDDADSDDSDEVTTGADLWRGREREWARV
jgi:hypothetical protein